MTDPAKSRRPHSRQVMAELIARKAERRVSAERRGFSVLFGLGMLGLVGWSVAIPTLLGTAMGLWLDHSFPGQASWTLTFLLFGLGVGCVNAWYWVQRQHRRKQNDH